MITSMIKLLKIMITFDNNNINNNNENNGQQGFEVIDTL